jgi:hypothetical protein
LGDLRIVREHAQTAEHGKPIVLDELGTSNGD